MKPNLALLLFLAFLLASCGSGTPVPATPSVTPPPTIIPTQTALPTLAMLPSPMAVPLYPTASVVNANAVAFVSQHGPISLWIANVDGSGERKIVDSIVELRKNRSYVSFVAQAWSPDGKWISYLSDGDLWITSPDGSMSRKILSIPDKGKEMIYAYRWSPDSSQIAYVQAGQAVGLVSDVPIVVGLLDLETGKTSKLTSYRSPTPVTFAWAPNGRYLLLSKMDKYGFSIFEIATRKFIQEIEPTVNCSPWHFGVSWSPNSNWFYDIPRQNGRFATTQICVAGLDGSHRQIDINGTATSHPVWDKTGNFLYFVASNTNFSVTPIPDYDLRLMQYDVRTQKQKRLLSLGKEPYGWAVSISPDGQTLELHSTNAEGRYTFIFMDVESLSVTKFNIGLEVPKNVFPHIDTAWSPDNKHIIIFLSGQPRSVFYSLGVNTGEITVFSGTHNVDEWSVSPVATTP